MIIQGRELRIAFIGGGNMTQAIVRGLLRAGHPADHLAVAEPVPAQRALLEKMCPEMRVVESNRAVAEKADILVLAVKPQVMPAVLAELSSSRSSDTLLASVAAGIPLAMLAQGLGRSCPAVRIMPNQPALIGEGMSVLVANSDVNATQRDQAMYVASSTGKALWVGDESLMDAVTAVSGSGPAYFYLFMEIMEECAVELGLGRELASALVRQTAFGAATAARMPEADLGRMRASVTSPGGTTAAALAVLDAAGIREILGRALKAARDRGAELGRRAMDPGRS